jgi:hypothetical protein
MNAQDEIIKAILEQRFVPLRLVDGNLLPPPRNLLRTIPEGVTEEQIQQARAWAEQQTPEERRAVLERLRARYHAARVELANSQV